MLRIFQFLEEFLRRKPARRKIRRLHRAFDTSQNRFEFGEIGIVLLASPLDRLLLAEREAAKTPVLLR